MLGAATLEGLPKQLLGLLVAALRGAHQAERIVVVESGRDVVRPHGLARRSAKRSASSMRPSSTRSSARPRWLSHSVARSSSGWSIRIASRKQPLCAARGRRCSDAPPKPRVVARPERPRRAGLREELARAPRTRPRPASSSPPAEVELARRSAMRAAADERCRSPRPARAPARRAVGVVELEPRAGRRSRARQRGLALEVLRSAVARELERLAHDCLVLVEVAAPPGDRGPSPERVEAAGEVVRLEASRAPGRRASPRRAATSASRIERPTSASAISARASSQRSPLVDAPPRSTASISTRDRREVAEPPGGARGVVAALERRLELDRAREELARGAVRLARERAPAGLAQRARPPRARARPARVAVELGEERGGVVEVVGADLEQLVARALAAATRRSAAWCSARADFERPRVGDLADQDVLEAVRRSRRVMRRALLRTTKSRSSEVVERLLDVVSSGREVLERAEPEDAADHGRALQHRLRRRRQPVDARGDQRLQRCRGSARAGSPPPRRASASSPRRRAGCPRSCRAAPARASPASGAVLR